MLLLLLLVVRLRGRRGKSTLWLLIVLLLLLLLWIALRRSIVLLRVSILRLWRAVSELLRLLLLHDEEGRLESAAEEMEMWVKVKQMRTLREASSADFETADAHRRVGLRHRRPSHKMGSFLRLLHASQKGAAPATGR